MSDLANFDPALPPGFTATLERGWPLFGITEVLDVELGSIKVPQTFSVTVGPEGDDPDWAVVFNFIVDGEPLAIRAQGAHAGGVGVDVALDRVRRLRSVAWWIAWARLQIVIREYDGRTVEVDGPNARRLLAGVQEAIEPQPRRIRTQVTDDLLQEVAKVYRDAWRRGDNPTSTVGRHFFKSTSTAARWVGLARKAGHLGPADSSRGGELSEPHTDSPA